MAVDTEEALAARVATLEQQMEDLANIVVSMASCIDEENPERCFTAEHMVWTPWTDELDPGAPPSWMWTHQK